MNGRPLAPLRRVWHNWRYNFSAEKMKKKEGKKKKKPDTEKIYKMVSDLDLNFKIEP